MHIEQQLERRAFLCFGNRSLNYLWKDRVETQETMRCNESQTSVQLIVVPHGESVRHDASCGHTGVS